MRAEDITIIQSYRSESVPDWIGACLRTVRDFARQSGHSYQCYDDAEVARVLPERFVQKVGDCWPMKLDLARLLFACEQLDAGVKRVVWLDADVLLLRPDLMDLGCNYAAGFQFGREVWLEESGKVRRGVHNAFCGFDQENPFLDYYIHACQQIMDSFVGKQMAPQLLGPKFLKAQLPFLGDCLDSQVEMWSPPVVKDLLENSGRGVYQKQRQVQGGTPIAVNLCHSLAEAGEMDRLLERVATIR